MNALANPITSILAAQVRFGKLRNPNDYKVAIEREVITQCGSRPVADREIVKQGVTNR